MPLTDRLCSHNRFQRNRTVQLSQTRNPKGLIGIWYKITIKSQIRSDLYNINAAANTVNRFGGCSPSARADLVSVAVGESRSGAKPNINGLDFTSMSCHRWM
ncbi:hypothetical protein R6Q59_015657 [Mikania micrantha]